MAVPTGLLWERDPHTEAKHRVLAGYFAAWFPILLQSAYFESVTVFEGFAGPGEYKDGAEGSPLLAMRALMNRPALVALGKPVRFVFLEKDTARADHLRGLVAERLGVLPAHITCTVQPGRCEEVGIDLLRDVGAWGQPIFANLDPFNANVPLPLVRHLGSNLASEAFVTFMSGRLIRFARNPNLAVEADATFGSTAWREVRHVQGGAPAKEAFLIGTYRKTLAGAGLDKIAGFKLLDEGGRAFWLLHGTRHPRGLECMKDAMWDVDPVNGVRFRDPKDPGQGELSLGWTPDLAPLRRLVADQLAATGPMSLAQVQDYVLLETAYRKKHGTDVTRQLTANGRVGRDPERGQLTKATRVWLIRHDEPTLFGG